MRPGQRWRSALLATFLAGQAAAMAMAPASQAAAPPNALVSPQARLHALYATLTVSLVLVVLLVFGMLVIKQVGRRATEGGRRKGPTEYVDAWSRYRLQDEGLEELDEPTRPDSDEDEPQDGESGDDSSPAT